MNRILKPRYAHPIEREYEGWIVHEIEKYLSRLGLAHAIWAVSPKEEVVWPADEKLLTGSKIIGLQFKQAKLAKQVKLAKKVQDFDRLNWQLHQPPGQFALIQKIPEIYYCLPTFVNRDFRAESLHHCIFWRPGTHVDYNVWYNNPRATTPYNHISESMRWGRFIEAVLSCKIGYLTVPERNGRKFVNHVKDLASEIYKDANSKIDSSFDSQDSLYLLAIELRG